MANVVISLEALGLEPVGCNEQYPRGALHGAVQIGSQAFHVEAYQVHIEEDGIVTPVLQSYAEEVEALYTLSGTSLPTQEIGGLPYVIAVFPHAA